jgi:ACS family sodium-dependent inorganic phosphate cotransporter
MATAAAAGTGVPKRWIIVGMCFAATAICYIDRVNISVAIIPMAEEYGWNGTTKGFVLSSFFIGYFIAMVPGGWAANRWGGKVLLGAALLFWSLFTFLTPVAAGLSFAILIAARIGMGLGEAATFPAVYNLLQRWLPKQERSRGAAVNLAGIPIGTIIGLSVTGALVQAFGWRSVFYFFGAAGVVFALFWFRFVHGSPAAHPAISAAERLVLKDCAPAEPAPVPWAQMLRSPPLWALAVNHFCANWVLYLMLAWLPSYFRDAQHLDVTSAGLFSVAPWLSLFAVGNVSGLVADRMVANGSSVTFVRKLFQITGLIGGAIGLLAASQATTPGLALLLMCLAMGVGGLTWAGFAANHLDIGPRHADVLFSLTNIPGTLPGIFGVALTGWLLDVTGGYTATFVVAAGINLFGALVWWIWGTGERVFE